MRLRIAIRPARKLPPGSIGPDCTHGVTSDDRFYLRLQERHGPLFKLFWGSRTLKICLVGFSRGRRFLSQNKGRLSATLTEPNDISPVVPKGYLRVMRGETHARYRRLFSDALSEELITSMTDQFRHTIRAELGALADAGARNTSAQSLIDCLNQISTRTLLSLTFGIHPRSKDADELYDLYCELGPRGTLEGLKKKQQVRAFAKIWQRVAQFEHAIRNDRENDFPDCVLRRLILADPAGELDNTVMGNAIHMVERGRHDLRDLLRWVVKYLSDNEAITEELRNAEARQAGAISLARACVMETLRLDQAETINRTADEALSFEGYHIPKNSAVSLLIRESHRDPAVFDDPDSFRPQRFLEKSFSVNEYSPFGVDAHQCIGSSFVFALGELFVDELARNYRWKVTADGPRHWGYFHWQPSASFAVGLSAHPAGDGGRRCEQEMVAGGNE